MPTAVQLEEAQPFISFSLPEEVGRSRSGLNNTFASPASDAKGQGLLVVAGQGKSLHVYDRTSKQCLSSWSVPPSLRFASTPVLHRATERLYAPLAQSPGMASKQARKTLWSWSVEDPQGDFKDKRSTTVTKEIYAVEEVSTMDSSIVLVHTDGSLSLVSTIEEDRIIASLASPEETGQGLSVAWSRLVDPTDYPFLHSLALGEPLPVLLTIYSSSPSSSSSLFTSLFLGITRVTKDSFEPIHTLPIHLTKTQAASSIPHTFSLDPITGGLSVLFTDGWLVTFPINSTSLVSRSIQPDFQRQFHGFASPSSKSSSALSINLDMSSLPGGYLALFGAHRPGKKGEYVNSLTIWETRYGTLQAHSIIPVTGPLATQAKDALHQIRCIREDSPVEGTVHVSLLLSLESTRAKGSVDAQLLDVPLTLQSSSSAGLTQPAPSLLSALDQSSKLASNFIVQGSMGQEGEEEGSAGGRSGFEAILQAPRRDYVNASRWKEERDRAEEEEEAVIAQLSDPSITVERFEEVYDAYINRSSLALAWKREEGLARVLQEDRLTSEPLVNPSPTITLWVKRLMATQKEYRLLERTLWRLGYDVEGKALSRNFSSPSTSSSSQPPPMCQGLLGIPGEAVRRRAIAALTRAGKPVDPALLASEYAGLLEKMASQRKQMQVAVKTNADRAYVARELRRSIVEEEFTILSTKKVAFIPPSTRFYRHVTQKAFASPGFWPRKLISQLLNLRPCPLFSAHVQGGLIEALIERDEWELIPLVIARVPDIPVEDMIRLYKATTVTTSHATNGDPASSNIPTATPTKTPKLRSVLAWCMDGPWTDEEMRRAMRKHLTPEEVLAGLAVVAAWARRVRPGGKDVEVDPSSFGSASEHALGNSAFSEEISLHWRASGKRGSFAQMSRLLELLLDTYLPFFLLSTEAHGYLQSIGGIVRSMVSMNRPLNRLRGTLQPYAALSEVNKAQAAARREMERKKNRSTTASTSTSTTNGSSSKPRRSRKASTSSTTQSSIPSVPTTTSTGSSQYEVDYASF